MNFIPILGFTIKIIPIYCKYGSNKTIRNFGHPVNFTEHNNKQI